MNRRKTLGEIRWPESPEFIAVAEAFQKGCTDRLLSFIWMAYDKISTSVLSRVDVTAAEDDLERSITQYLEPEIHQVMDEGLPFYVQHGPYEHETRVDPPAQPPAYDLAFILYDNRRIMWPIEAKLLRTDQAVAEYIKDVQNQFLTCRYAPFSSQGAMVGYLLSGDVENAFKRIADKIPCTLAEASFAERPHKLSDHVRLVPPGKQYPSQFRCHHLMLLLATKPVLKAA